MRKIKKGDTIIVIAGRDKGRQGVVSAVLSPKHGGALKLLVEGVQVVKKHTKPNPAQEKPGGIVEKESPIAVSNVAILNPSTGKADRVGFKILDNGNKVRVFKSTGDVIES